MVLKCMPVWFTLSKNKSLILFNQKNTNAEDKKGRLELTNYAQYVVESYSKSSEADGLQKEEKKFGGAKFVVRGLPRFHL
jgi:hypothetical protein